MTENSEIVIGNPGADHVSIKMSRYGHDGWSSADIEVQCDGWFGRFRGSFRKGELSKFAEEISHLYQDLTETARLEPLEPNIALTLAGDGKGHITVEGTAQNHFMTFTHLEFRFMIDQAYLKDIREALSAADPNLS